MESRYRGRGMICVEIDQEVDVAGEARSLDNELPYADSRGTFYSNLSCDADWAMLRQYLEELCHTDMHHQALNVETGRQTQRLD